MIRRCPFFRALGDGPIATLIGLAQRRRFDAGQRVFNEGDAPPGMYIVASGAVRVFKLAPSGKVHVLHIAAPGQTFAEVAVLGDFPCPASAEAIEPTDCVLLPAGPLGRAMQRDVQLTRGMLASQAAWVRQLVGLLEDVVLRDAVGRVARYLLGLGVDGDGNTELPALKKDLASHLNLTSETLSRTLRRLDEAGLIENRAGQSVRLINRTALQDAADGLFPTI